MPRGRNDYETAQIQQRLWTPAVLLPAAWWDASDISTIVQSGGNVTEWKDKSGNAVNANTGSAGYSIGVANGLNAVQFNGSNNLGFSTVSSSKASMTAAVMPTVTAGGTNLYAGICSTGGSGATGSMLLSKVPSSSAWGTYGGANVPSSGSILSANRRYILMMDGISSGSFFEDGRAVGTYSSTEGQGGHIGGGSAFSQGFVGYIYEIIWRYTALSGFQRQAIEGYLSWKWGIPLAADHPFANRPPLIGD